MPRNPMLLCLLLSWLAWLALPGVAVASADTPGLALPASFRGELPCADCAGIRHHLDLWPDGVFHLRRSWVGRPARPPAAGDFTHDDIGRWRIDPARGALVLAGSEEPSLAFSIENPRRLRLLDRAGQPIESSLPYALTSDGTLAPTPVARVLGGELAYLADAARFTACRSGRDYPVAFVDDWVRAERAYLDAATAPGARVYVTFEGRIEPRPRVDGEGSEPTVSVTRFIGVSPGMRCERARADVALTNTYWRIARLGDVVLAADAERREPHLVLRDDDGGTRFSATAGCNRIGGSYILGPGDAIEFGAAMSTKMACPPPRDEHERALIELLGRAARWRIAASVLELFDDEGVPLAVFEAVHL